MMHIQGFQGPAVTLYKVKQGISFDNVLNVLIQNLKRIVVQSFIVYFLHLQETTCFEKTMKKIMISNDRNFLFVECTWTSRPME